MVATPYQLSFDYDGMAEAAAGSFERASRHLYAFVVFHNASRKWHVAKHYRDLREYGVNGKVIVEYCREKANSSPFVCPLASQLAEHHPVCGSLPIVAVGASSNWEPKTAEACERSRSQTSLERLAAVPWKFADVSHMILAQTTVKHP